MTTQHSDLVTGEVTEGHRAHRHGLWKQFETFVLRHGVEQAIRKMVNHGHRGMHIGHVAVLLQPYIGSSWSCHFSSDLSHQRGGFCAQNCCSLFVLGTVLSKNSGDFLCVWKSHTSSAVSEILKAACLVCIIQPDLFLNWGKTHLQLSDVDRG